MIPDGPPQGWRDVAPFLRAALTRAKTAIDGMPDGRFVPLGDTGFRFTESSRFLDEHVDQCLAATGSPPAHIAQIHADYSGWHAERSAAIQKLRAENLIEFDARLQAIGLRAVYSGDRNSWDVFDPAQALGVRLQCGTDGAAEWEQTAPLAHFCKWIAAQDNKTMLHAASIAGRNKGALLIGQGGTGKSGTTLGGLIGGLRSAGDDYSLISNGAPYVAHAVYRTVKQTPDGLARLNLPMPQPLNWQGKSVFRPESLNLPEIENTVPIDMIVMPQIGAPRTTLTPGNPAAFCKIMAFSTLRQLGTNYASVFKFCAQLVRNLPCYTLHLSADHQEITSVLRDTFGSDG